MTRPPDELPLLISATKPVPLAAHAEGLYECGELVAAGLAPSDAETADKCAVDSCVGTFLVSEACPSDGGLGIESALCGDRRRRQAQGHTLLGTAIGQRYGARIGSALKASWMAWSSRAA